uniref:Uncharacterized protein n=1 Tax=Timema shepardi TaxID=629360 RepID=A0A7R9FUV8_TIMSH|nr:unnamed protein product [Timema shepardi]
MTIATDLEEKEASLLPPRFLGNPLECVTTQEGSDVILTLDIEPSGGAPTAISWYLYHPPPLANDPPVLSAPGTSIIHLPLPMIHQCCQHQVLLTTVFVSVTKALQCGSHESTGLPTWPLAKGRLSGPMYREQKLAPIGKDN